MSKDEAVRFLDWLQQHAEERRRFQDMNDEEVVRSAQDLGFSFSLQELQQELQGAQQTGWTFFR